MFVNKLSGSITRGFLGLRIRNFQAKTQTYKEIFKSAFVSLKRTVLESCLVFVGDTSSSLRCFGVYKSTNLFL